MAQGHTVAAGLCDLLPCSDKPTAVALAAERERLERLGCLVALLSVLGVTGGIDYISFALNPTVTALRG